MAGFLVSYVKLLSHIRLFATPWTVAHQAPLSMGFSRQEYWSGLPFPSPGNLPYPGIEPRSPALRADSLPTEPQGKPVYLTSCGSGLLSNGSSVHPTLCIANVYFLDQQSLLKLLEFCQHSVEGTNPNNAPF